MGKQHGEHPMMENRGTKNTIRIELSLWWVPVILCALIILTAVLR